MMKSEDGKGKDGKSEDGKREVLYREITGPTSVRIHVGYEIESQWMDEVAKDLEPPDTSS